MSDLKGIARQIKLSQIQSDVIPGDTKSESVEKQIIEGTNADNVFDDIDAFENHKNEMRKLIESEYSQKKTFRKIATYGAFFLVVYSTLFITLLIGYLIVFKDYIPPSSVMIGIAVSFIANIIGLATIVFKYIFSSTKETTDYISNIDSH